MKHKVSELEGALLDAAVAIAVNGPEVETKGFMLNADGSVSAWDEDLAVWRGWCPSTDWRVGGPIIELEQITVAFDDGEFCAGVNGRIDAGGDAAPEGGFVGVGPTYLIAAMRAYVASKFGEDVELPTHT